MRGTPDRTTGERGYTVVELLVVVLVIAILIGIAIPSFLGTRTGSEDRAAQSSLRLGMTTARGYLDEHGSYTGFGTAEAREAEPSLSWNEGPGVVEREVTIREASGGTLILSTLSLSGQAFCIAEAAQQPVRWGPGNPASYEECSGGW